MNAYILTDYTDYLDAPTTSKISMDLTLELIDIPVTGVFSKDDNKLSVYIRDEMKTNTELIGEITSVDGKVSINAPDQETADLIIMVSRTGLSLMKTFESKGLLEQYANTDEGKEGILITYDEEIDFEIVAGEKRPDLVCANMFGGTVLSRPYSDEQIGNLFGNFMNGGLFGDDDYADLTVEELIEKAEEDDEEAINKLAHGYLDGDFEEEDFEEKPEKAIYWFEKLAELGRDDAANNIGVIYARGEDGIERDLEKAVVWFEKALELGSDTAEETIKVFKQAIVSQEKAEQGDIDAQAFLSDFYLNQVGDYDESFDWAEKAADNGSAEGCWLIGCAYANGRGCLRDDDKSLEYHLRGSKLGHAGCMNNLALAYMIGEFVEQDMEYAFHLFLRAARGGYQLAYRNLGGCYWYGNGVEADEMLAIKWFKKAVDETGDSDCEQRLYYAEMSNKMEDENFDFDVYVEECLAKEDALYIPEGMEIQKKNILEEIDK